MTPRRHSLVDRALCLVTEVRGGEGAPTMLLSAVVYLLMCAYYVIKPVREELILSSPSGAEFKSYSAGAAALLLLLLAPLYEQLLQRTRRERLLVLVGGVSAVSALGFFALSRSAAFVPYLGIPFYLWASMLGMVLVAQFWALANDIHSETQGKRLFVILGLGQSLGAVTGSKLTAWLLGSQLLGTWGVSSLLLVSACLLMLATMLLQHTLQKCSRPATSMTQVASRPAAGLQLLVRHRYVGLLAGLSLVLTFVNSNGEYLLGRMLRLSFESLPPAQQLGYFAIFYGDFYFYVNLLSLLVQALLVSRIVRFAGLGRSVMALPMIAMVGATAVAFVPMLALMRAAKTMENAVDYSLNNTARNMLWLPTTTDMKYKAKYLVDTFMVRLGDMTSGIFVFISTSVLPMLGVAQLDVRGFALVNGVLCIGWLALARALAREHALMTSGGSHAPRPQHSRASNGPIEVGGLALSSSS